MKIALRKLVESSAALGMLAQLKGPAKFTYKIARAVKLIQAEYNGIEQQRRELIAKFGGVLDEKKTNYVFEGDNAALFAREWTDLLDDDVDLAIDMIPVPDSVADLSANELLALEWLLTVKE